MGKGYPKDGVGYQTRSRRHSKVNNVDATLRSPFVGRGFRIQYSLLQDEIGHEFLDQVGSLWSLTGEFTVVLSPNTDQ